VPDAPRAKAAQSVEPPSVNVTVPLRAPTAGAITDTLATNVTGCSGPDEPGVEVTTVLVWPRPTDWVTGPESDPTKFESPE
jgi:hypothetical protein